MPYYIEPVVREPNVRGRPRLVTVLGDLLGAQSFGFDGDGTPKGSDNRLWGFKNPLPEPLPLGVVMITDRVFTELLDQREAIKPMPLVVADPDPEEVQFTPAERKALRALLK